MGDARRQQLRPIRVSVRCATRGRPPLAHRLKVRLQSRGRSRGRPRGRPRLIRPTARVDAVERGRTAVRRCALRGGRGGGRIGLGGGRTALDGLRHRDVATAGDFTTAATDTDDDDDDNNDDDDDDDVKATAASHSSETNGVNGETGDGVSPACSGDSVTNRRTFWRPSPQPPLNHILITDVTANRVTVTVRESSTGTAFFHSLAPCSTTPSLPHPTPL